MRKIKSIFRRSITSKAQNLGHVLGDDVKFSMRFILDEGNKSWVVIQTKDANAEVVYSRKTLSLKAMTVLNTIDNVEDPTMLDVKMVRFSLEPDCVAWSCKETPDCNAQVVFNKSTGILVGLVVLALVAVPSETAE